MCLWVCFPAQYRKQNCIGRWQYIRFCFLHPFHIPITQRILRLLRRTKKRGGGAESKKGENPRGRSTGLIAIDHARQQPFCSLPRWSFVNGHNSCRFHEARASWTQCKHGDGVVRSTWRCCKPRGTAYRAKTTKRKVRCHLQSSNQMLTARPSCVQVCISERETRRERERSHGSPAYFPHSLTHPGLCSK